MLVPTGQKSAMVRGDGWCEKTGEFLDAIFFAFKCPDGHSAFEHHLGHGPQREGQKKLIQTFILAQRDGRRMRLRPPDMADCDK